MTTEQLRDQAVAALERTTITYPEYQRRVHSGYYTPKTVVLTKWWQALDLLNQIGEVPAPAPSLASLAQNVIFAAQEPLMALGAPSHYKIALSADPAYAQWATTEVVAQLRARGHGVYAWGNQNQIGTTAITGLRSRLGLDETILQAETSSELQSALNSAARLIVGNPNAWTDAERTQATLLIHAGHLAVLCEVYTNEGDPWPDAFSSQGVPVASFVLGVYPAKSSPSIADYRAHTPAGAWPGIGIYHAAGIAPGDLGLLP